MLKMDALKAQGKEKFATYRQYMGNRLFYNRLFALYKEYAGATLRCVRMEKDL